MRIIWRGKKSNDNKEFWVIFTFNYQKNGTMFAIWLENKIELAVGGDENIPK